MGIGGLDNCGSLICNDGEAIQHLQYLPYGESYVNHRIGGYNERYTFTGKERDEETGYTYHGARYYDASFLTSWLAIDPMADKYPSMSPYNYCAWNPICAIDPNGMDSIKTPNGMANAGVGYKASPDGKYLYGDGLQTKKWNPHLETGGVVGECGGYENCDAEEVSLIGISTAAATSVDAFNDVVGIGSDGLFSYKRTKNNKLSHGTASNRVKPIGNSILGKASKVGGNVMTLLLSYDDVRSNCLENGIDSPETYSAIGGAIGTGVSLWASTAAGVMAGSAFAGIGAIPGAVIGFAVGIGVSIGLDQGGRAIGTCIYKKTH